MRTLLGLLLVAACGGSSPSPQHPGGGSDTTLATHDQLAGDDDFQPPYNKADLEKALIAERAAEATAEKAVMDADFKGDDDAKRAAAADLAVRRRFIASLEVCQSQGHECPPRLDDPAWTYDASSDADPKLDTPLRFDLEDWQKVTAELHARACACRTAACVASMDAAIDTLEARPMQDVRGDATASLSVTRARECLTRLAGRGRTYPRPD
ncbi:MAG: hypothetical protein JO257_34600 [Deltaproteobacteria bacterium]|nr:hypothetical protein [Deltaproteobacteria bacterium]